MKNIAYPPSIMDKILFDRAEADGSGLIVPPKTVSNVPPVAE